MVQIGVITNPNSKKNQKKHARSQQLKQIVGQQGVVYETSDLAELPAIVDSMAQQEFDYWVGDGGDGTVHWMLNTVWSAQQAAGEVSERLAVPLVVPTNGGTIDFIANKAGIKGHADSILKAIVAREALGESFAITEMDSMAIEGETLDGEPFSKIGFAVAIAGVSARFFDMYYATKTPGPQTIMTIIARGVVSFVLNLGPFRHVPIADPSLRTFADELFRRSRVKVTIDGEPLPWDAFGELSAGSIDVNLGGVVRLFPHARLPGQLHFQGGQTTLADAVANLPRLMTGRSIQSDNYHEGPGVTMTVEALEGETISPVIDGEQFRGLRRLTISPGPRICVPEIKA